MNKKYIGCDDGTCAVGFTIGKEYKIIPLNKPLFQDCVYVWKDNGKRVIVSTRCYLFE